MSDIAVFDEGTNAFKDHIQSVNHAPYQARTDVVIYLDSDVSAVEAFRALVQSVPAKYLRHDAGTIREMTQGEKDAVDAGELAAVIAAAKAEAKAIYDSLEAIGRSIRALGKMTVDEVNILRQWTVSFKTETAAATNLANFQSRVATLPTLSDRTYSQAKTAYSNQVDGE